MLRHFSETRPFFGSRELEPFSSLLDKSEKTGKMYCIMISRICIILSADCVITWSFFLYFLCFLLRRGTIENKINGNHLVVHQKNCSPEQYPMYPMKYFSYHWCRVGCIVLYTGQGKFHGSTIDALDYIVKQANTTAETLRNVSNYLDSAKRIGVDSVFLPSSVQTNIENVKTKINSSAATLSSQTSDNSENIQDVLDAV